MFRSTPFLPEEHDPEQVGLTGQTSSLGRMTPPPTPELMAIARYYSPDWAEGMSNSSFVLKDWGGLVMGGLNGTSNVI
jgi:hypothetical protein